jgi:DNA-binding NarL/FixJ family response regulator
MNNRNKRILIIDDHPLIRAGFAQLISAEKDLQVCGEAEGKAQALRQVDELKPDLVIIDLSLADGSGLDLILHIKARKNPPIMLVASMYDELLFAERALSAGARGYINKREAAERMIYAIRRVLSGKVYLSETMTDKLLNGIAGTSAEEPLVAIGKRLSNREMTVFDMIGEGNSTSKIAELLNLSVKTIETHQANIKKKLGLHSAMELNRKAIQWHMERG